MLQLNQVSLPIKFTEEDIYSKICKILNINKQDVKSFEISKLSVDVRKKPDVKYIASLLVELRGV